MSQNLPGLEVKLKGFIFLNKILISKGTGKIPAEILAGKCQALVSVDGRYFFQGSA